MSKMLGKGGFEKKECEHDVHSFGAIKDFKWILFELLFVPPSICVHVGYIAMYNESPLSPPRVCT